MGNRGPQPLPPEQKRVHRFHVHINEAELEKLESVIGAPGLADLVRTQSARRKGMRVVADLVRAKLLGHRAPVTVTVPELNQRLAADLGRVGGNVNQLAHHLNKAELTGNVRGDADAILAELHDLRDALEDVLLGIGPLPIPAAVRKTSATGIDLKIDF